MGQDFWDIQYFGKINLNSLKDFYNTHILEMVMVSLTVWEKLQVNNKAFLPLKLSQI